MVPDRVKLPLQFDASLLQNDLTRLDEHEWIDHFVKRNYEGNWSVIPLRCQEGVQHPVMMIYSNAMCETYVDTPFLQQCPYFQKVLAQFKCPLTSVRLMKLSPGSQIREHCDNDLCVEDGWARLHIPVTTNVDVTFCLNGTQVVMGVGECWYVRLSDPHSVVNQGKTDRVHMVIDARVNEWLCDLLRAEIVC